MALIPKHLICASALLLGLASTVDASPIYQYLGNDLTEFPGLMKCLPQCAASDSSPVNAPDLPVGTNPSVAALHADIPAPWNDSKTIANFSVASLHADIPPPWANLIGQGSFASQNSNNIEGLVAANSSGETSESLGLASLVSASLSQTATAPVGFFANDASAGASITDVFDITEIVGELGLGSTHASDSGNQAGAVMGTIATAVGVPGTSTLQEAVPFAPSSSNSVPEPSSVGLVGLGMALRLVFSKTWRTRVSPGLA